MERIDLTALANDRKNRSMIFATLTNLMSRDHPAFWIKEGDNYIANVEMKINGVEVKFSETLDWLIGNLDQDFERFGLIKITEKQREVLDKLSKLSYSLENELTESEARLYNKN